MWGLPVILGPREPLGPKESSVLLGLKDLEEHKAKLETQGLLVLRDRWVQKARRVN